VDGACGGKRCTDESNADKPLLCVGSGAVAGKRLRLVPSNVVRLVQGLAHPMRVTPVVGKR